MKKIIALSLCCVWFLSLQAQIRINEIRIDQPGTDVSEYIELSGPANASLNNLSIIVIGDGNTSSPSGIIEEVIPLAGSQIPADGYFLVAESSFSLGGMVNLTFSLNFENGDNLTFLLVNGFSGMEGDDLDTNDDGTLESTPWTSIVDGVAMIEEPNPPADNDFEYATPLGFPTVGPNGTFVPGHTFRLPNGTGNFMIGAFDPDDGNDTPGVANVAADCAITATSGSVGPCDPETNEFTATIMPTAVEGSPSGYTFTVNGGPVQGPFPYDVEQEIGTFDSDGQTTYAVVVTDVDDATCTRDFSFTAPLPCQLICADDDALVLTAIVDGPLGGGLPKAVELYALEDIPDLSSYGLDVVFNGGLSDGAPSIQFPADAVSAGEYIYVATEVDSFNFFFGFDPDYTFGNLNFNGDDVIELYCGNDVIDVYGEVGVDGTGQPWEYTDSWAYRNDNTGPDGSTFVLGNWTIPGIDTLDGETMNSTAELPVPIGTYVAFTGGCPTNRIFDNQTIPAGNYAASNSISTTNTVSIASGATVTFNAQTITLGQGFTASSAGGTSFTAQVNPCTPLANDEVEMRSEEAELPTVESVKVFPNPFRQQTQIQYELNEKTEVVVAVTDINGKVVAQLVNGLTQDAGLYQLDFDAANLSAGLYFVLVKTQNGYHVEKISVIK